MERIRVVFSKAKEAVYMNKEDLICVFENSLNRANILFNYLDDKTPDFTFAYPLDVGMESVYEMVDIVLKENLQISYFVKELNKNLPSGITCLLAEYIDMNAKSIEMSVFASVYVIHFIYDENEFIDKSKKQIQEIKDYYIKKMKEYLSQYVITIVKKSDGMQEKINIKDKIKDYSFMIDGGIELTLDTGIRGNLSPDEIMQGYNEYINKNMDYNVKRIKILYK